MPHSRALPSKRFAPVSRGRGCKRRKLSKRTFYTHHRGHLVGHGHDSRGTCRAADHFRARSGCSQEAEPFQVMISVCSARDVNAFARSMRGLPVAH